MRRGRARRGRRLADRIRDLEALVRTVVALDGAAASGLLAGLSTEHRRSALALLHGVERASRAERHAGLVRALAADRRAPDLADEIPGALGEEVRRSLAPGAVADEAGVSMALARWARRLAGELGTC